MGRRGDCDCICAPVYCNSGYSSVLNGVNNTFTCGDLSWLYEEDLEIPASLTLTHCETFLFNFGDIFYPILNHSPFTFATLNWNEDAQRFEGEALASPNDDLSLSMTIWLEVCRYSGVGTVYNSVPFWMLSGGVVAPSGVDTVGIRMVYPNLNAGSTGGSAESEWGRDKFITGVPWLGQYSVPLEVLKSSRRDKYHRFLWMLPEVYSVDRSGWAGLHGYSYPATVVSMPSSPVTTRQHWPNYEYFAEWESDTYLTAGLFRMFPNLDAYIQRSYFYGLRDNYGVGPDGFCFFGDNDLVLVDGNPLPAYPTEDPPATLPVDFVSWEE